MKYTREPGKGRLEEQETVGRRVEDSSRSREKIFVKKVETKSEIHADLLKKMQSDVRDLGIKIKNIREAKNGNIEITAAGKNEGKEAFIKLIEEKMQGTVEAQKIVTKSWPVTAPGSQGVFGA
jgi:acylphosphatase